MALPTCPAPPAPPSPLGCSGRRSRFARSTAPPRPAPAPAVEELALLALEQPEAKWKAEDRAKEVLARQVAGSLADRAAMLADYFSLVLEPGVDRRPAVAGVPALLEGDSSADPTHVCKTFHCR